MLGQGGLVVLLPEDVIDLLLDNSSCIGLYPAAADELLGLGQVGLHGLSSGIRVRFAILCLGGCAVPPPMDLL